MTEKILLVTSSRKIIPLTDLHEHVPKTVIEKVSYIDKTLEKKGKRICFSSI